MCFIARMLPVQNADDCCNTCEEVREAYRRKGWAFSNAELIEQVSPCAELRTFSGLLVGDDVLIHVFITNL